MQNKREAGLPPAMWTALFCVAIVVIVVGTLGLFYGSFKSYARVTIVADRVGLLMEPNAKVKLRGVQVGRVSSINLKDSTELQLELYPDQLKYIPSNVEVRIAAPTAFGAKFVEFVTPSQPSSKPLAAEAVLKANSVSIEVNSVFQNLAQLLDKIDVAKLNGILSAVAEGLRGRGPALGQAITDINQVLAEINPRTETIREDWRSLKGFADTYAAAAPNIVKTLDALSTTSTTIADNAKDLDALLLGTIGLSQAGINLIGPNQKNLIHAVNVLEPTTSLLMKYNPELTCLLVGGKTVMDWGWGDIAGGRNGYSIVLDATLMLGDDPYKYPDNLPSNDIKGGPGGTPGCGSLPDVSKNWPQRYLVTNSGWGTGMDVRPNPGIGFPGISNFFPVTKGTPEAPKIRYPGGPAPGPIPYPGAPPYGAQLYAPDGTPLYPGLPPAPPPGRPHEPGPPVAGTEPFVPAYPGAQPSPAPFPPVPPPGDAPPPGDTPPQ